MLSSESDGITRQATRRRTRKGGVMKIRLSKLAGFARRLTWMGRVIRQGEVMEVPDHVGRDLCSKRFFEEVTSHQHGKYDADGKSLSQRKV